MSLLNNDWGVAVFASARHLRYLQQCNTVYIDGTFRTAPRPYQQIVTIHGFFRNQVLPFVFCLLDGKAQMQYQQIFRHLKRQVRIDSNHRLRPTIAICDFEAGLIGALEAEFPNIRVHGCYFHFTQSLWRHVQELGLAAPYRENTRNGRKLKQCVRKLMAIGFIPTALVRQNFRLLRTSRRIQRLFRILFQTR